MQIISAKVHAQHDAATELLVHVKLDSGAEVHVITDLSEGNHVPNARFVDENGQDNTDLLLPIEVTAPPVKGQSLVPNEDFIIDLHTALDADPAHNKLLETEMERICG